MCVLSRWLYERREPHAREASRRAGDRVIAGVGSTVTVLRHRQPIARSDGVVVITRGEVDDRGPRDPRSEVAGEYRSPRVQDHSRLLLMGHGAAEAKAGQVSRKEV